MWLKLLNGLSPHQVRSLIERPWMDRLIIVIILFNAVILGLATSNWIMERAGTAVHAIDRLCLWFFVVELLAKIYAYRKDFFEKIGIRRRDFRRMESVRFFHRGDFRLRFRYVLRIARPAHS